MIRRLLPGLGLVIPLVVLYLLLRLVRAAAVNFNLRRRQNNCMSPRIGVDRRLLAGIAAVVAVAVLLYSVLILQRLLAGVILLSSGAVALLVVYLLWRLVRALERIATALEADADAEEGDVRGAIADGGDTTAGRAGDDGAT